MKYFSIYQHIFSKGAARIPRIEHHSFASSGFAPLDGYGCINTTPCRGHNLRGGQIMTCSSGWLKGRSIISSNDHITKIVVRTFLKILQIDIWIYFFLYLKLSQIVIWISIDILTNVASMQGGRGGYWWWSRWDFLCIALNSGQVWPLIKKSTC